jgi:hypothetical protein
LSQDALNKLIGLNCAKVDRTVEDFFHAVKAGKDHGHGKEWSRLNETASVWCQVARGIANHTKIAKFSAMQVGSELSVRSRAELAVDAWGSVIMKGAECCTLADSPYCTSSSWTVAAFIKLLPIVFVICAMLLRSAITACRQPVVSKALKDAADSEASVESQSVYRKDDSAESQGLYQWQGSSEFTFGSPSPYSRQEPQYSFVHNRLYEQLEEAWLRNSCLRVLPNADAFAHVTAGVFACLQDVFDFQPDNVRNQFEHALSLWRSQCAVVADKFIEQNEPVDENNLLLEALSLLHQDLLDGFLSWRKSYYVYDGDWPRLATPSLGGATGVLPCDTLHKVLQNGTADTVSTQLAEISMYLLVWGEAGNLRFMPEMVYFIVQLALDSDGAGLQRIPSQSSCDGFHSHNFLSRVIRPIYNVVFDELYEKITIDDRTQKDKKTLRPGFDAYLPADAANYDDWNELFCNLERLSECLVLKDGSRLLFASPEKRFISLARVSWSSSLDASEVKSHREVHSLWGLFAATHRIWLLHAVLFLSCICVIADDLKQKSIQGTSFNWGRFASVGLLVPTHASLHLFARWQVTGSAFRSKRCGGHCRGGTLLRSFCCITPLVTYVALYVLHDLHFDQPFLLSMLWTVHYSVTILGLSLLLLVPSSDENLWTMSGVTFRSQLVRYSFWVCVLSLKFMLGFIGLTAMLNAIKDLGLTARWNETPADFVRTLQGKHSLNNFFLWFLLWATSFLFYITDTQLCFVIVCSFFGVGIVFVKRGWRKGLSLVFEDAVAKIPERLTTKVFCYGDKSSKLQTQGRQKELCTRLPVVWDRIIEYMRCEDKIDNEVMCSLCFERISAVEPELLTRPFPDLESAVEGVAVPEAGLCRSGCGRPVQQGLDKSGQPYKTCCQSCAKRPGKGHHDACCNAQCSRPTKQRTKGLLSESDLKLPEVFRYKKSAEIFCNHYAPVPEVAWPTNPDVQWRIVALARGLGEPMPRPYQVPYIPGLTVLIPHFAESIRLNAGELFKDWHKRTSSATSAENVPLVDWLKSKHPQEFSAFAERNHIGSGARWGDYDESQWAEMSTWASMRMQTLWRTVAGMCLYHPALQCHYEVNASMDNGPKARLAHPGVWDPSECFTCLVSMQQYKFFNNAQIEETNQMLEQFPDCLKIAYIDFADKGEDASEDHVHPRQPRRYFSCLVDRNCQSEEKDQGSSCRRPRFRVELPGYPILGDGKGDNQNHAMPFMRGSFAQCIDANQGAYFEQMLMLPCALGEFRNQNRKRIVGFPEHITSDIGSVGDMAATAETSFGTIIQRSMAVLGARMHYGHPDIMNKQCMMQQGGVSKATKTLNLSEDIFAGMDFKLRGGGREIVHCEYFNLAKGRDLGFNTVIAFFSKLASGSGEQILTRQMFRLGECLPLPEFLTFFYNHVGYYLNQFFVSWSTPLLLSTWLMVILSDCEVGFEAFQACNKDPSASFPSAEIMAKAISTYFSWLLLLFLIATSLPLFAELWLQRSFKTALIRILKQLLTFSPLLFIFQAKTIGHYMTNELRFGGATYVSTGRGLPTERRPFLRRDRNKFSGLYMDYATIAYYDGIALLGLTILVLFAGGLENASTWAWELRWLLLAVGLIISSWLYAPFLFNPYMFSPGYFMEDMRAWFAFFFRDSGKNWVTWYNEKLLRPHTGPRSSLDCALLLKCFFFFAWYEVVSSKVQAVANIYSQTKSYWILNVMSLLPPIATSVMLCFLVAVIQALCGKCKREPSPDRDLEEAHAPCEETPQNDCAVPLSFIAFSVLTLEIAEAFALLRDFWDMGWTNAVLAGLVLKLLVLMLLTCLGEDCLRALHKRSCSFLPSVLRLWVQSHRMILDLLTSTVILVALMPLVFLNSLNDGLCPGCSVHQLLIFRDHKPPTRESILIARKEKPKRSIGISFWRSEITRRSDGSGKSESDKSSKPSTVGLGSVKVPLEYTSSERREWARSRSRMLDGSEVRETRTRSMMMDDLEDESPGSCAGATDTASPARSARSAVTPLSDTIADFIRSATHAPDGVVLDVHASSALKRSAPGVKSKSKVTFHFPDGLPIEKETPFPVASSKQSMTLTVTGIKQNASPVQCESDVHDSCGQEYQLPEAGGASRNSGDQEMQGQYCCQAYDGCDEELHLPRPCKGWSEVEFVAAKQTSRHSTANVLMTPRYGIEPTGFSFTSEQGWTCQSCNLVNDLQDQVCGVCGDPRNFQDILPAPTYDDAPKEPKDIFGIERSKSPTLMQSAHMAAESHSVLL